MTLDIPVFPRVEHSLIGIIKLRIKWVNSQIAGILPGTRVRREQMLGISGT